MSPSLRASVRRVLVVAAGAVIANSALAAETQSTTGGGEISEIVIVTGSYIRGTAEDAALPVDVISAEELEKQGAPSAIDMLKSLTVMNGIIGESNRFTSGRGQATQGSAEINLRGFGAERTLTLLNGKRLASQDANLMPSNAIARVEVLKDGGASTYGSDAIGGVVNFITKENVDGLSLSADYRYIEDSDGDYNAGVAWGTTGDNSDFFVAVNYYHRSVLDVVDRDWGVKSFAENPQGGWTTGSNPGAFRFLSLPANGTPASALNTQLADPGCEFFGGVVTSLGAAGNQCQTQYTRLGTALVEEQDTYQAFTSYNLDLSDTTRLHLEGLFAFTDIPNASASPSGTTTRRVTATTLPAGAAGLSTDPGTSPARSSLFYVPLTNPGFVGAFAPGAGYVPAGVSSPLLGPAPRGGYITLNQWRPFLATGNPAYDDGTQRYKFERDNARFSADLTGEWGSINWLASTSFGIANYERLEADISTARLQLALRGLGGANCNGQVSGTPGSTCQYFNPFSSGIKTTADGQANPNYVASADVNTRELVQWLEDDMSTNTKSRLSETNLVLSGELPVTLPGGAIGWAAGGQFRYNWFEQKYGDTSQISANPCVDTPINGTTTCSPYGESPYNFLATYNEIDVERSVYAVFTELSLPILDSLNAQVAARFEDYGDKGGSSFDPKLSVKWQALEQLAFRGSVSTTFRAPPLTSLIPDERIAFVNILGASRPVGTLGNADLEPEESFQWSVGAIMNAGNFRAIVDYWSFDIDKLLTVEPSGGIVNLVFPNGVSGTNNCATADPAFLADRFTFAGGVCDANNILKVQRRSINGAGLKNTGVDITVDYTFEDVAGGTLVVGAAGTWIDKYETETLSVNGIVFEQGFDGVGFLNQGTSLYALPEWRAQGYLDYSVGNFNVRWTSNFVDQYRDQRNPIFVGTTQDGRIIDSSILHNLTFRTELPWNTTLLATVENLTDEDPSFARLEVNYDPLTGFPLGRTFKLGVRVAFD